MTKWQNTFANIGKTLVPQQAVTRWGGESDSLTLVNKGINLVYRFLREHDVCYLRLTHPNLRSKEELLSALHFQHYLYQANASVCQPLKSQQDQFVESIILDNDVFYAHVNAGVPGKIFDCCQEGEAAYRAWGQSLAYLHQAAKQYHPQHDVYKSWQELWQETESYLTKDDNVVYDEFNDINNWLQSLDNAEKSKFGLTHGDHRAGNIINNENTIYIIDFDEPVYHWFHADIARPFLDLQARDQHKFFWLLDGYNTITSLSAKDVAFLPWFARMKNLEIYLWLKNNWYDKEVPGGENYTTALTTLYNRMRDPAFTYKVFNI